MLGENMSAEKQFPNAQAHSDKVKKRRSLPHLTSLKTESVEEFPFEERLSMICDGRTSMKMLTRFLPSGFTNY